MKKTRLDYVSPLSKPYAVQFEGGLCQSPNGSIQTGAGKQGYGYFDLDDEDTD